MNIDIETSVVILEEPIVMRMYSTLGLLLIS